MNVQEIQISKIKIVENHRTSIEKTHLDELMQSIKQHGLIQPIGVSKKGNGYTLRFGQRRFLACQKLGYKSIPATVTAATDEQKMLLENLTENMQRKDPSFAELGRVISKLEKDLSLKEISVRLGIPILKLKQIVEVYHMLPEKYRKRVVFMEKGGGRKVRKGFLPAQVATKIVDMKKKHGLNDKSIDSIFNAAVDENMDRLDLDNVGHLIVSGMSAAEALKNVRQYGVFTVDIVAKHEVIADLVKNHCLMNRKSLFKKIVYGEIPALKKPGFISTGLIIKRPAPEKISNEKFAEMRKSLIKFRGGSLTESQVAALKSTNKINPKEWTEAQCEQIQEMFETVKS